MKNILLIWAAGFILAALPLTAQTNLASLVNQHVDIRILYTPDGTNNLSLAARNENANPPIPYSSNQVVLVGLASSKLTLPGGTPFGNAGDPLWVLPQSQDPSLLYLGFSAEGINQGIFNGALRIQLVSVDGPGNFFLWQYSGGFVVKMNTSDGISTNDSTAPIIGSHEHFNWGFSAAGAYYVTLQVSGTRVGESAPIQSPETTFVFHILPLRPFEVWQQISFPSSNSRAVIGAGADPDSDGIVNLLEYGIGTDPNGCTTNPPVFCKIISAAETHYGALVYPQATNATDVIFSPVASDTPGGASTPITNVVANADQGTNRIITVRDYLPAGQPQRYYQLRARLNW